MAEVDAVRRSFMSSKRIENTIPVLPVQDLERSIEFFRRILGFNVDWKTSDFCSVARDGCSIMLQRRIDGSRGTVWIGLEDDSLYAEIVGAGATVIQAPTKRPWAYEMKIADPDGNTLWLGTDPADD
jgi:catechol 2,3-dioxygenase-like lactoylglutathione lyase family enzyme